MGLLSSLFGNSKKIAMTEFVINRVCDECSLMGAAYKEISYSDVVDYIKEKKLKIIRTVDKGGYLWIEFYYIKDGVSYSVMLDKTFEGNGSVLSSQKYR